MNVQEILGEVSLLIPKGSFGYNEFLYVFLHRYRRFCACSGGLHEPVTVPHSSFSSSRSNCSIASIAALCAANSSLIRILLSSISFSFSIPRKLNCARFDTILAIYKDREEPEARTA